MCVCFLQSSIMKFQLDFDFVLVLFSLKGSSLIRSVSLSQPSSLTEILCCQRSFLCHIIFTNTLICLPMADANPVCVCPAVFRLWYMIRTQPIINTRCGPEICFYNLIFHRQETDAHSGRETHTRKRKYSEVERKQWLVLHRERERRGFFSGHLAYLDLCVRACLFCLVCGNLVLRYACYSKWEIRLLMIEVLPSFMTVKIRALNPGRHSFLWAKKWHAIRNDISSAPNRELISLVLAASCLLHWC